MQTWSLNNSLFFGQVTSVFALKLLPRQRLQLNTFLMTGFNWIQIVTKMHLSRVCKTGFQIKLLYRAWGLAIFRATKPLVGWCVRSDFCRCRIQYQDPHSWSTGLPLQSPALPFETSWCWLRNVQDDCFVAGTSWRGQLWKQTYLHYNYNPAIFGFGWGPTNHVNIPRIELKTWWAKCLHPF